MDSLEHFFNSVPHKRLSNAFSELKPYLTNKISIGDGPIWERAFENLPSFGTHPYLINQGTFSVGESVDSDVEINTLFSNQLKSFIPWRKGPFNLFGTHIDTEWQSNLKWDRLKKHLTSLNKKIVLDVGCNNGYYMFRMLEQNPKLVIGIDPSVLCYYQFKTVKKYIDAPQLHYLPCGLEQLHGFTGVFDTVFSMGIMYHRKSPLEYLKQTLEFLKVGGEAIIETITIPGSEYISLCPEGRYAQMRNVYFLPTVPCLVSWIKKAGFIDIEVVDTTPTTFSEQKDSEWVENLSLKDFLDPNDSSKTVEGYPAPERTTIIAHKRPKQKFSY